MTNLQLSGRKALWIKLLAQFLLTLNTISLMMLYLEDAIMKLANYLYSNALVRWYKFDLGTQTKSTFSNSILSVTRQIHILK